MFDEIRYSLQEAAHDLRSVINRAEDALSAVEEATNSIPAGDDEVLWVSLSAKDWETVKRCMITASSALDTSVWAELLLVKENVASIDFVLRSIQDQLTGV